MAKQRLQEVELLRGVAMLGVVGIHVFNAGLATLPVNSRGYGAFYYFHNFLNFAVPTFILISAMMAAYTNLGKPLRLGEYYKKKALRVGVPYLFWTLFYLGFNLVTGALSVNDLWDSANWSKWFLCGKAYTHLYFMALILQFYILFPLLFRLAKAVQNRPIFAFVLALGPQIVIYWLNKLWLYTAWPYFHSSFAWYYCIAFAGLYLGLNYHKLSAWLDKRWPWVLLGFAASTGIFLYYKVLSRTGASYHTFPYTMDWQFFVVFTALFFLWICRKLVNCGAKLGQALAWVGTYSFGIYLIHPVCTYVFSRFAQGFGTIPLFLLCCSAVLLITVVCGFAVKWLQSWNPTAYLFGAAKRR